jgi:hypothetical protein
MRTVKQFGHWVVLSVGVGALALAFLIGPSPAVATSGPNQVVVTNTPLPVLGAEAQTEVVAVYVSSTLGDEWTNPSDTRVAVIETVSCQKEGNNPFIRLGTYPIGTEILLVGQLFPGSSGTYLAGGTTRLYVPPGMTLQFGSDGQTSCTVGGHTEPYAGVVIGTP